LKGPRKEEEEEEEEIQWNFDNYNAATYVSIPSNFGAAVVDEVEERRTDTMLSQMFVK
jgi:hypothetical protein